MRKQNEKRKRKNKLIGCLDRNKIFQFFMILLNDSFLCIWIVKLNKKETNTEKLDKEIARLQNEVARGEKMLSNPGFIAKAPQEKIELEKNKLESYKKELQQYLDKKNCL